ncbi:hypothetical protein MN608_08505 [Microdochium nivale]|nr:hypothetical protein MN608_08505 [Microdochium nivale]
MHDIKRKHSRVCSYCAGRPWLSKDESASSCQGLLVATLLLGPAEASESKSRRCTDLSTKLLEGVEQSRACSGEHEDSLGVDGWMVKLRVVYPARGNPQEQEHDEKDWAEE